MKPPRKYISLIILMSFAFCLSALGLLYAGDCQIIEYLDKTEVVCIGDPQDAVKDKNIKQVAKEYSREPQPVTAAPREEPKGTTVNSCKMLNASHYNAGSNPEIEVEVSCEIVGRATDYFEFVLYGLGREGDRLLATDMSGYIDSDGHADIKKTFVAEFGKFINAHKWEPGSAGDAVLVSKTYLFNEKDTTTRIAKLRQEAEERKAQSSASSRGPGSDIKLFASMGAVLFKHSTHSTESCGSCHKGASPPGKISGIGKEWAHQNCKGCHSEKAQGPTTCKGCHKK